ncbi:MAG: DNA polymerase IV [Asticcacaulis sp.]
MMDDEPTQRPQRKIIHVDMDAFFASVEQRDHPELRGKPVAVGGSSERGVVAAASYEARKFGVHSAMPSVTAKRKCPELIFVRGNFDTYRAVSQQIREIFAYYTPLIQPLSLDEAYLDVTDNLVGIESATQIAEEIREKIKAVTGLTASAGVSYNKFLAKLASDQNKPDGLFVIRPAAGPEFAAALPVQKFHGIGPATAAKMHRLGLMTGADIRAQSLEFLEAHFGVLGRYYYGISRGIDHRPVEPNQVRKSIGAENTFFNDIADYDSAHEALIPLIDKVWRYSESKAMYGRTITLKVKFSDFKRITRSQSDALPLTDKAALSEAAFRLLAGVFPVAKSIRLLGVSVSSFDAPAAEAVRQLSLPL